MGLISGKTYITSLSLFHITVAYFFLTNPMAIIDTSLVWIIGESMGMPEEPALQSPSPALAFLAVILGIMGLTDLLTLNLPEDVGLVEHWGLQGMYLFSRFPYHPDALKTNALLSQQPPSAS